MKEENIRKIAINNNVKEVEVFIKFLTKRFLNENDNITSYFNEWATRFNTGMPEKFMDETSKETYFEIINNSDTEKDNFPIVEIAMKPEQLAFIVDSQVNLALYNQKQKIFDRVDDIITNFCINRDIKDVELRNLIFDLKKEFDEILK